MTILYQDNFDSTTVGGVPAGWSIGQSPGFNVVTAASVGLTAISGANFFAASNSGDSMLRSGDTARGNQGARMAVRVTKTNQCLATHTLRSNNNESSRTEYVFYPEWNGTGVRFTLYRWNLGVLSAALAVSGYYACADGDLLHQKAFALDGTAGSCDLSLWLSLGTAAPVQFMTYNDTSPIATGVTGIKRYGVFNAAVVDNYVSTDGAGGEDVFYTAAAVSFSGPVPTRNGTIGAAASFANAGFFAGGNTPFVYTNVGAALPAGLTLSSSTGIISGTPTTAGTTSGIIIRATDSASNIANTNSYSIVIAATNAAPTFPGNISNLSGTAGVAITPVNVSGQFSDTDTLTYTASPAGTAWPSGLVVNSSTGIISGSVASAGTTSGLKVRATDTNASTVDSNAFNAVIAASSTTRTWTPTIKLEALADETPFPSQAVHAQIIDMAGNLIATKTGLVTNSVGLPPSFTTSAGALATDYRVLYVDDTDPTWFSIENLRCV